jgi:hypothetical protein
MIPEPPALCGREGTSISPCPGRVALVQIGDLLMLERCDFCGHISHSQALLHPIEQENDQ